MTCCGCSDAVLSSPTQAHPFPLLVPDDENTVPFPVREALKWAPSAAIVCNLVYHPDPEATLIINDLPYDVEVFVTETKQSIFLKGQFGEDVIGFKKPCRGGNDVGAFPHVTIALSKPNAISKKMAPRLKKFRLFPRTTYRLLLESIRRDKAQHRDEIACVISPKSKLDKSFTLHHIEIATGENPVQWALISTTKHAAMQKPTAAGGRGSEQDKTLAAPPTQSWSGPLDPVAHASTICVAFKGTTSVVDVAVDVCGVALHVRHELGGLRVHGGMWAALHTAAKSTAESLLESLKPFREAKRQPSPSTHHRQRRRHHAPPPPPNSSVELILTGHSLGGGLALLVALELLAKARAMKARAGAGGVTVDCWWLRPRVITFGAPMCIVPDADNPIWRDLRRRACLFVNAWDAIPRLPSSRAWMFHVLPSREVAGIVVAWAHGGLVEKELKHAWGYLERFDVCGTLVFLDAAQPGRFMSVAAPAFEGPRLEAGAHHREVLGATPPTPGFHVISMHKIGNYIQLTQLVRHRLDSL